MSKPHGTMKCYRLLVSVAGILLMGGQNVYAQEEIMEELIVTGSRIAHDTFSAPSPVRVITAEEMRAAGQITIDDVIRDLTINTGSNLLGGIGDAGPAARGRSMFNLRGLRPEATLVLVNGQRMPLNLDNFVDTNAIPMSAIGRIEIVKESGSAIYGSDAIAGVVNFVTREDFEGFEFDYSFQTTTEDQQQDRTFSGALGAGNDEGHVSVFFEWFNRKPLLSIDRDFFEDFANTPAGSNFSTVGRNEFLALGGPAAGQFLFAPTCVASLGVPTGPTAQELRASADPADQAIGNALPDDSGTGFCGTDTELGPFGPREGPQSQLLPRQARQHVFVTGHYSLPEIADSLGLLRLEVRGEFKYSRTENRTLVDDIPIIFSVSGPAFSEGKDLVVPADLDDPQTAVVEDLNPFDFDVAVFGDQLDTLFNVEKVTFNTRAIAGVTADFKAFGFDDWSFDFNWVYGRDIRDEQFPSILIDRFDAALRGAGGENEDLVFNPFVVDPVLENDPAVIDDFLSHNPRTNEATVRVINGVFSGSVVDFADLYDGGGGPLGIAAGFELIEDALRENDTADSDRQNLVLLGGDKTFPEVDIIAGTAGARLMDLVERDSWAVFGEVNLPVHQSLDLSAALRFQQYNDNEPIGTDGIGDSTDPHLAVNLRPLWWIDPELDGALRLRFTYGTGFRAPSVDKSNPGQSFEAGVETLVNPFEDANDNFVANCAGTGTDTVNRVETNRLTGPENSENFTIGLSSTWKGVSVSVDFQHIEIDDVIGSREAQDVLNNACLAVGGDITALENDPALAASLGVTTVPGVGIIRVEEQFVNSAKLEQDVIDWSIRYQLPAFDFGQLSVRMNATLITDYDLTRIDGRTVDVNDNTNDGTILDDVVEFRANWAANWFFNRHSATVIYRYLSGFDDIRRGPTPAQDVEFDSIGNHGELDFTYTYALDTNELLGIGKRSEITVGVINLLNANPPNAPNEPRNFVRQIHDARGRLVYARFTQTL